MILFVEKKTPNERSKRNQGEMDKYALGKNGALDEKIYIEN